jgi:hypothetical protein
MTANVLSPVLHQQFFDNNGEYLVGGKLTTYAAGTTTPLATYNASGGTNTNPITLDARGSCDCWIPPNTAYKFLLQDALGNTIPGFPIDNVIVSQLLTLYGGVDTGSTNAYTVSFAANFSAYADGIIIWWIPSHTNNGASTLNVDPTGTGSGYLGVTNITNPDGSALVAGQIVANQPAQVLYKGGAFQLLTPAQFQANTFTAAWTGFSAAPGSTLISYRKVGNLVTLVMPITNGTSNATTFTMTGLPAALWPAAFGNVSVNCFGMEDNGAYVSGAGTAVINGSSGIVTFYTTPAHGGWTASGAKGFLDNAQIVYSL